MSTKTSFKSPFILIPSLVFLVLAIGGFFGQIMGLFRYFDGAQYSPPVRELFFDIPIVFFLFGTLFSISLLFSAIQLIRLKENACFGVYLYTFLTIIRSGYSYLPVGGEGHLKTNEYPSASGLMAVLIWVILSFYMRWLTKRKLSNCSVALTRPD